MAKQKEKSVRKKRQSLSWHILITIGILVAAVAAYIILENPSEEDLDLSIIEQGANVVVQIHDPN